MACFDSSRQVRKPFLLAAVAFLGACASPPGWVPTSGMTMPPASRGRSDSGIRTDFLAAMVADPDVDPFNYRVRVSNGAIQLRGTTGSSWEKEHLEELAERTPGVQGVDNRVKVSPQAPGLQAQWPDPSSANR